MILFGGIRESGFRFCNKWCRKQGETLIRASEFPDDEIYEEAIRLRESDCPLCESEGPLDVFQSHYVYSLAYLITWGSKNHLCCRRCARKKQAWSTFTTLICGWWGPLGFILSPYQICRNVRAIFAKPDDEALSEQIWHFARMQLAERESSAGDSAPDHDRIAVDAE